MRYLLVLLLLIPSLSWGNIKLVCQGHSMSATQWSKTGEEFFSQAKYNEKPSVVVNESIGYISVRGVSDGIMFYDIPDWKSDDETFYGVATNQSNHLLGQISIDRLSGAMMRESYFNHYNDLNLLNKYYYDCNKAERKF